jgi:MFS family permease
MEKELVPIMHNRPLLKLSLLLTGSMTVLAGAGIAAAIPEIQENFASHKNAEFFSKMMLSVPALFIALLAPFAGQIIDRFGRKTLLIVSLIVYAVAGTSGFYLSDIISLLIGRALLGVAVAGIMTINVTLIGDYFSGSERSRFMGWQGAFMAFGGVLFVSVGGLLADFSWRMPFLVYAFSIIVLILTIIYIYEPDVSNRKTQTPPGKVHMSPGKIKKSFKKYGIVYSTAFVGMLFFYMIPTQIPFLLARSGQISNTSIGYSISLAILAGAVLSANYGKIRKRFNFYQIYAITFFLIGTGFLVISFSHSYSAILTGLIVAGFGTGLFMPNTNLWLISLASPNHRGRLVGILNLFVYSGQFLSPILAYPLIQWQSINFLFGICSLFILFLILFFLLQKKLSFQAPD